MALNDEIKKLDDWADYLPKMAMELLNDNGGPFYKLDLIFIGAIKRSMSLTVGLSDLIKAKNITLCRAILRMQMDTVGRMMAYTYVDNPSEMALKVIGGVALNTFQSRDGSRLTDAYLIGRMNENHPWMKDAYKRLSGYVHFSENQIFDSIVGIGSDAERTITIAIGKEDDNFPDDSWTEIAKHFNELLSIFGNLLVTYRREIRSFENRSSKA